MEKTKYILFTADDEGRNTGHQIFHCDPDEVNEQIGDRVYREQWWLMKFDDVVKSLGGRIVDLDNLCPDDCKYIEGDDKCGECLRTGLHDMVNGQEHSFVPDMYTTEGGVK